jgi:hypothetical protein
MNEFQPSLFDLQATVTPKYDKEATIQERFEAWIAANPSFWRAFIDLCLQMKRRGMHQWGAKAACEVLRFAAYVQTVGEEFRIPNSYTSRLARKAMAEVPELDGFFETRCLREGESGL